MDREGVSELYRRFGPLVYRRCLKLLLHPERARDATQEVFVRALKHRRKLTNDREGLPWLYRVATNYCLNQIRNGKRLEFREPERLPQPLEQRCAERWLGAREQVIRLLSRADERTSEIAVLALMDGMTQEEVAEVTGLSRRTVGKRLRSFVAMAQALSEAEEPA